MWYSGHKQEVTQKHAFLLPTQPTRKPDFSFSAAFFNSYQVNVAVFHWIKKIGKSLKQ